MYQYIGRCAGKSFKRRRGRIEIIADFVTAAGEEAKNLDKVLSILFFVQRVQQMLAGKTLLMTHVFDAYLASLFWFHIPLYTHIYLQLKCVKEKA